jgi:hypothetical protein
MTTMTCSLEWVAPVSSTYKYIWSPSSCPSTFAPRALRSYTSFSIVQILRPIFSMCRRKVKTTHTHAPLAVVPLFARVVLLFAHHRPFPQFLIIGSCREDRLKDVSDGLKVNTQEPYTSLPGTGPFCPATRFVLFEYLSTPLFTLPSYYPPRCTYIYTQIKLISCVQEAAAKLEQELAPPIFGNCL